MTTNENTIGVVGLGNMGSGMALSLQRAGFTVLGHDKAEPARAALQIQGLVVTDTLAELAAKCGILILSLPNSDIIEAVVQGILAHAQRGSLIIDTSTAHPDSTRRLVLAAALKGIDFIDAPVSGGARGATTGSLTMLLGGAPEALERAQPVLAALTARRVHVGPAGAGHTAKLLNNLLCASHLLLAGEAERAARAAGLDPQTIFEGINTSSGRSAVTEVNYPRWIFNQAFDSGFSMALMRKDVNLALDVLASQGTPDAFPMAQECARLWRASAAQIADAEDFNCVTQFRPDGAPQPSADGKPA